MDLDDPLEGGPCYQLYTTEFYEMLKTHLNPGGIFVTQVMCGRVPLMSHGNGTLPLACAHRSSPAAAHSSLHPCTGGRGRREATPACLVAYQFDAASGIQVGHPIQPSERHHVMHAESCAS
eukprot:scaffold189208_cov33-Tisochrysis_lutea.AAC.4